MSLKSSSYKKKERWFTLAGSVLALLLIGYLIFLIISIRAKAQTVFSTVPVLGTGGGDFDFQKYDEIIRKTMSPKQ